MVWLVVMEGDCVEMEEIGAGFAHDFRGWVSNMLIQNSNPTVHSLLGLFSPLRSAYVVEREITGGWGRGGRETKSVCLSAFG
jgi:hypothetical protein